MLRLAINGMGRIGRATLKIVLESPEIELIAVNDIASVENIAYLLKYDTVHGRLGKKISATYSSILIDDLEIPFFNRRNPEELPWEELSIDYVIESTGVFTAQEDAEKHIKAGAKTVVISGPTKSPGVPTVVHGVNSNDGRTNIFSCASCTTNNISPVIEILGRRIGIKKAIMTTIHADTASNSIVDAPASNFRMGRTGLSNLIPTSTGAAVATTKALPEYIGRFDGIAVRTPVAIGSVSDITLVTSKSTNVVEINDILKEEANTSRYKDVFDVTLDPIVSSDIIKSPLAALADLSMTKVVDGDLVKILAWYDNEWGFANQMIRQIIDNESSPN